VERTARSCTDEPPCAGGSARGAAGSATGERWPAAPSGARWRRRRAAGRHTPPTAPPRATSSST
jgi:hypothetical protein